MLSFTELQVTTNLRFHGRQRSSTRKSQPQPPATNLEDTQALASYKRMVVTRSVVRL